MIPDTLPRRVAHIIERVVYHLARLFLALNFLAYGASKLLNLQFAWGYEQFDRPVRQLGGMGLVWTFFAYSRPYQICIGVVEIVPALLLLSQRTTALGAVIYLPVIVNVVLVDLCYTVRGGTESALMILAVNLLLLGLERSRILGACRCLIARPGR
ncbi:MAG TPA: hypothetical protein VJ783_11610 [Pirellulales bacterium]|nr:hypothetical protein [Pirellulales bacterium]